MKLSPSQIASGRVRLPGRSERAAQFTGYSPSIGYLLAVVALAAGGFILLVGLRQLPIPPATVRAPYWMLQLFGAIFLLSGLIVAFKTERQRRQEQRRLMLVAEHPGSAAFADHAWDPRGVRTSPWSAAVKAVGSSLFFALFLLPFNGWAWFSDAGSLMVRGVVGLFDLFLLLALVETARRILVALKYGVSGVDYNRFPVWTGERAELVWLVPSGLEASTAITFVLRCVEEWTEQRGSGRDRSVDLIHEQLWAATQTASGPLALQRQQHVPLSFDLPATVPGSRLARDQHRRFWELEVRAAAPGVDFSERYLVPVYARAPEAARFAQGDVVTGSPAVERL